MDDTQRIDWIAENHYSLISDDFGHWACVVEGFQSLPDSPEMPDDIDTCFFVKKEDWHNSIREAIDYAIKQEEQDHE